LSAEHIRSFAGFRFPSPDFVKANSWIAGPNGELNLFLRLQAARPAEPSRLVKTGSAANVLSSMGDRFSYTYTVPCDGKAARAVFEYTNTNTGASGGTFRLNRLAAATCTNSAGSRDGDYDVVTVSGFGRWSKDAEAQITPGYVSIFVFQNPDANGGVVLSNANTKPADKPLP
jgi:hypothetical protein